MLVQMAGKGNASDIVGVVSELTRREPWRAYFHDFPFPYTLYGDHEYKKLVTGAGLALRRIELFPKTMVHKGREGFSGWIRTTWHPYLERLPAHLEEPFVRELVATYERRYPSGNEGFFRVGMARLEVEAVRES